jgi:hypothetical protein
MTIFFVFLSSDIDLKKNAYDVCLVVLIQKLFAWKMLNNPMELHEDQSRSLLGTYVVS